MKNCFGETQIFRFFRFEVVTAPLPISSHSRLCKPGSKRDDLPFIPPLPASTHLAEPLASKCGGTFSLVNAATDFLSIILCCFWSVLGN
jgi:hypothetical protein